MKKQGIKPGKGDALAASQSTTNGEEVDPNEPVYCTCQQVSSGKMVGCDEDDCRFEWFHIECVGLLEPPPDSVTWFCPECCEAKGLVYRGGLPATLPGAEVEGAGGGGDGEAAAATAEAPAVGGEVEEAGGRVSPVVAMDAEVPKDN